MSTMAISVTDPTMNDVSGKNPKGRLTYSRKVSAKSDMLA